VVFWVVVPCSLLVVYHCFRGASVSTTLTVRAACSSEMLVYNWKTTWCNNPEDHHLAKEIIKFDSFFGFLKNPFCYCRGYIVLTRWKGNPDLGECKDMEGG
jgi:hypothetical protein